MYGSANSRAKLAHDTQFAAPGASHKATKPPSSPREQIPKKIGRALSSMERELHGLLLATSPSNNATSGYGQLVRGGINTLASCRRLMKYPRQMTVAGAMRSVLLTAISMIVPRGFGSVPRTTSPAIARFAHSCCVRTTLTQNIPVNHPSRQSQKQATQATK